MKQHEQYPLVAESEAEGVAWAFQGPNQEAVKYPFKFPALRADEIRIKQTYFGLCFTDCTISFVIA
jgi:D-arabinose 1-dehydrogenase-like Zn-dependent alcohol dehydrogenase